VTTLLAAGSGVVGLLVGSLLVGVVRTVSVGEPVWAAGAGWDGARQDRAQHQTVLSRLLTRYRSRRISPGPTTDRCWQVRTATAAAFAGVAGHVGLTWSLPAFLYLAAISVALAAIDIRIHRLPNAIVLPSYPVAASLLTVPALAVGETVGLLRALAGMVALGGFFLALALIHPAGMGVGDVKLAGLLGMYLAWLGWSQLVVGAFLAFLAGGLFGIAALTMRRAHRRSRIPFGPFMLLGSWAAILLGDTLPMGHLGAVSVLMG
jgi:leader peptidase (prepilin peptidase) / N-methyltransferase